MLGVRTPGHHGRTIGAADTRINHAKVADHSTEVRRGDTVTGMKGDHVTGLGPLRVRHLDVRRADVFTLKTWAQEYVYGDPPMVERLYCRTSRDGIPQLAGVAEGQIDEGGDGGVPRQSQGVG